MKVRSFLPNFALSAQLFTTASMLLLASTANAAITVYTTQASFDAATLAPGVDGYNGFLIAGTTPSPITRSAGAYSYQAAAPGNYSGAGKPANPWLSTFIRTATVTFDNFPSSVRGVGGLFFTSDSSGAFAAGNITVAARDSSGTVSQTIVNSTTGSFLGFVSTTGMLSLTVTAVQTGGEINRWATIDDLRLAQAAVGELPLLSINDSAVIETNTLGTDTSMAFTLNLSEPAPAGGVSGTFSTSDGVSGDPANSAGVGQAGGNDYASQSNVAFAVAAGATSGSITVPVRGDLTYEFDEDFRVTLNAAGLVGAILDTSTAQGLIENDDSPPTVLVNSPSVIEGTGPGTTTMTFNLSLDRPTQRDCDFGYESFADAAAQGGGVDFDDVPNTQVNLTGVNQTATVNVNIIRDALVEPNETFKLDVFGEPNDCDIFATNAVGTIVDDDSVSTSATLSIASETSTETNSDFVQNFTVTRSNSDTAFSVSVSASANTATLGSDFNVPFAGTQVLNFAAGGALSQTIPVTIVGDTIVEPTETFALTLSNVSNTFGVTTLGTAVGTGTILDDDVASVSVNDVNILEGNSGSSNISFTVTRTAAITMQSVQANVSPASASPGLDYTVPTPNPQTLSFAIGELTKTIDIAIIGDRVWEANETLSISLSATTDGLVISDDTGIGTITNDDIPVINVSSASITEGDGPGTTAMNFTLTAADPTGNRTPEQVNGGQIPGEIRVGYRTVNGSAVIVSDFLAVDSNLTFSPGQRTRMVSVQIVGDTIPELTEQFTLETYPLFGFPIGNADYTIGTAGIGIILDNDSELSLSINDVSVLENAGSATLTVSASSAAPVGGAQVDFTTVAGTALAGSDFTARSGTVTIAEGATSASVVIAIANDTVPEPIESLIVRISNARGGPLLRAVNYSISKADGVITINDDDTTAALAVNPATLIYGQATTLTATIVCGSTPTGTAAFNSGATSLGSAALIAGATVGTATATLNLPLLNAGSYSAVANYAGAGACGSASSPAVSITVNPAATTLILSGPARSRINQPIAFSGALSIVAPGAGAVAGTITLTSAGSAACSYSALAVSSCNLSWNTLGAKTITAAFTPSTGNYLPSTSNVLPTFVFALADLDVSISNQVSSYQSNDILLYTLILNNRGPDFAPGVRLRAQMPSGLFKTSWTCTPIVGAICPEAGGVADIDALVQTLPANGQLIYTLSGVVITPTPLEIRATAAVTLPSDGTIEDPVLTNQSATDVDAIDGIFRNGFED